MLLEFLLGGRTMELEKARKETTDELTREKEVANFKVIKQYRQLKNGWITCRARVPVKKPHVKVDDSSSSYVQSPAKKVKVDNSSISYKKSVKHSEEFERSIKHLYHKDKRYTCPDCEKWYDGDQRKIQLSSRHRLPYESEYELKRWDISFPGDSDEDNS